MSKRCHDCKHLKRVWRCVYPLPMHMDCAHPTFAQNHDSHARDCDCFEHTRARTSLGLALKSVIEKTDHLHHTFSLEDVKEGEANLASYEILADLKAILDRHGS